VYLHRKHTCWPAFAAAAFMRCSTSPSAAATGFACAWALIRALAASKPERVREIARSSMPHSVRRLLKITALINQPICFWDCDLVPDQRSMV
jgi:hypothetical protein